MDVALKIPHSWPSRIILYYGDESNPMWEYIQWLFLFSLIYFQRVYRNTLYTIVLFYLKDDLLPVEDISKDRIMIFSVSLLSQMFSTKKVII